ncbi:MAG TPA: RluA family pseudouridine synthase [Candidatus Saccharimonadales bacterium]|nr:RluA family pseudouridine synthase [Candidatus Saccharimonadales bacterium]
MVKVSSGDIVAILRRFDYANEDIFPRHIEQIKFSHPKPINTLVSFRFNRHHFYILFDDAAEDDPRYILEQIHTDKQDVNGKLVENPHDHLTTYALPFKGKEVYLFEVISTKKRLDIVLAERYPNLSRSTWQKHIKAGHVSVNGIMQSSPKLDVSEADSVAANLPSDVDYSKDELPIIYLDDNVIVINKPVGVLTHSKGAINEEFTVAEFFRRYTTAQLGTNRPGIVHRLDRDTSGVMIGARNPETMTLLQKQFSDRKVKKAYLAILDGTLKHPEAKIDLPIGRSPSQPATFRVDSKGRAAVTSYKVLATKGNQTLVLLRPYTGRTHQLRVHMQYLGAPILGDRVYGKAAERLYLHAFELEVTIPRSERRLFTAPAPDEFTKLFPNITP